MAIETLYESDNLIVVNKPYDMYINSDDENVKNTVACYIAQYDSHLSSSTQPLHFVQRLDYSTSGILCIAKNKRAAAEAGRLFEQRRTRKYYLAVLRGNVGFELADVLYEIGSDESPLNTHKMVAVMRSDVRCGRPRSAHTRLLVTQSGLYRDEPATVVVMKPVTGRRHQLRVHCHAIGHTILGDYTYSDREDTVPHRMFLHAARLVISLKEEPLDIKTTDPFTTDPQFTQHWSGSKPRYSFEDACDVLDSMNTDGLQYSLFQKTE